MANDSKVRVEPATRAEAAQAFAACAALDPEGQATPESLAGSGVNLRLIGHQGECLVNVGEQEGAFWIFGAAGRSQGITPSGLQTLERIALRCGLERVRFQTIRRGLVRQAQRAGYRAVQQVGDGYIMEKVIE